MNEYSNEFYPKTTKPNDYSTNLTKRNDIYRNENYSDKSKHDFKKINLDTSTYLTRNSKKTLFSYKTNELAEKKLISNICNKIKIFWKKFNNTYPFCFKLNRLEKTDNDEIPLILIEKQQYNFKKINPNNSILEKNYDKSQEYSSENS